MSDHHATWYPNMVHVTKRGDIKFLTSQILLGGVVTQNVSGEYHGLERGHVIDTVTADGRWLWMNNYKRVRPSKSCCMTT